MAQPVFDATAGTSLASGNTALSWSHTCTGASYLIVSLWIGNNHSGVTVTYNSVSMTNLGSVTNSNNRTLYLFGLANPSAGANTVACAWTTSRLAMGSSLSYTNVSGVGTFVSTSGTTTVTSTINLDTTANDIGVDACAALRVGNTTPPTITADASQTEQAVNANNDGTNGYRKRMSDKPGGGSIAMTWTITNEDDYCHVGIPLKGSVAAGFFPFF